MFCCLTDTIDFFPLDRIKCLTLVNKPRSVLLCACRGLGVNLRYFQSMARVSYDRQELKIAYVFALASHRPIPLPATTITRHAAVLRLTLLQEIRLVAPKRITPPRRICPHLARYALLALVLSFSYSPRTTVKDPSWTRIRENLPQHDLELHFSDHQRRPSIV